MSDFSFLRLKYNKNNNNVKRINLGNYAKMTGSNQKCTNTGNAERVVDSQLTCQQEAIQNNARYYSYANAEKTCFYSTTCSDIVSGTGWEWNIYEKGVFYILHRNLSKEIVLMIL